MEAYELDEAETSAWEDGMDYLIEMAVELREVSNRYRDTRLGMVELTTVISDIASRASDLEDRIDRYMEEHYGTDDGKPWYMGA